jgi:hypothetical protein
MKQHKIGGTIFNYEIRENGIHIVSTENDNYLGLTHLILDEIDGVKVTTIGDYFLYYNESLTSIELPNVTTIGDYFLCYNKVLTSIELPNVTTIGDYFLYCNKVLTSIELPKVTTIGNYFLCYNKVLTSIELPNVTTIGDYFLYCNKVLTSIELPNVTTIGDYFLYYNETLIINKGEIVNNDGIPVFVKSRKTRGEFTIIKGNAYKKDGQETYLANRGKYSAHGESIEKAIEDCNFKFLQATINVKEYAKEVKEKGVMTIQDYRLLTGACEQGCKMFLSQNNLKGVSELPLDKALPLVNNAYGFDRVREYFNI